MAEVTANGLRFHIQRLVPQDSEPVATVVFIHGLGLDNLSSFYYTLAGAVVKAGAEALLYDLRGHGLSEMPPSGYRIQDGVSDLNAILDALDITGKVFLLGNSYGGILAVDLAIQRPDRFSGLILIDGHGGAGTAGWIERVANSLTVSAVNLEHNRVVEQLTAIGLRKQARMAAAADALLNRTMFIEDLATSEVTEPAELKAIDCPVLAVYGANSELVDGSEDLVRYIQDCEVKILPGLAHTLLIDATGSLRDTMLSWLRSAWA